MINFNVKYLLLMDTANDAVKGSGGLRLKRILAQAIARPPRWMAASEKGNLAIAIQQVVQISRFSIEKLRAMRLIEPTAWIQGRATCFRPDYKRPFINLGRPTRDPTIPKSNLTGFMVCSELQTSKVYFRNHTPMMNLNKIAGLSKMW